MAKDKNSFVLYSDQQDIFTQLSDEEAGKLIKHIFAYVNDENPEISDKLINLAFTPIKQTLKRDLKKYEERAQRARENGAKGGRPKETQKTQSVISKPRKPDSDSVSDNVSDNVSTNVDDMHPTLSEVMEKVLDLYGEEVVHSMSEFFRDSAKAFFYYYDSQGWVKGNGMTLTKWETKLKEWVEKDRREQRPRPELPKSNPAAEKAEHFKNAPTLKRGMI